MRSASSAPGRPLRVIKVGGSLLGWPLLPATLGRWLDEQPPACNVLIAGGGALADLIRRADATHGLGEQTCHQLCLEVLGVTARLLAALLNGRAPLASWAQVCAASHGNRPTACCVLDVRDWSLRGQAAAPGLKLPHTWDVTSDSIAAAIACGLGADELVLLKSCAPPAAGCEQPSPQALAAAGYVDPYFPPAVAQFSGRLTIVNLRGLEPTTRATSPRSAAV